MPLREVCENLHLVLAGNHGTPSFNPVWSEQGPVGYEENVSESEHVEVLWADPRPGPDTEDGM